MKETDLADVVCLSERKIRDLRLCYLKTERDWVVDPEGHVAYTDQGIHEMEAALGLVVGAIGGGKAESGKQKTENAQEPLGGVRSGFEESTVAEGGEKGAVVARGDGNGSAFAGGPASARLAAENGGSGGGSETKMVLAMVCRAMPNARLYVAKVLGTRRVLRLRTKVRMGLKAGRKLWCVDLGGELLFDRTAARARKGA